jgi:Polysaccharide deacetylase
MHLPKKSSKKISDRSSNGDNGRTSSSGGKGSSLDSEDNTSFKEDAKPTEPIVPPPLPLSAETPTNSKYVIINFDDSHESEYTYAKPILDKYGFKATFFEVCNWIEAGYHDKDISVTWKQIAALQ